MYCETFVDGGWGTRSALKRIAHADLEKMGVKMGHARLILGRLKKEVEQEEEQEEAEELAADGGGDGGWQCLACTLTNGANSVACGVCDAPRGLGAKRARMPVQTFRARPASNTLRGDEGEARARSYCRFVLPRIHFIPDPLTHSVPISLKRQCDRTLGEAAAAPSPARGPKRATAVAPQQVSKTPS
jgi:hypothetical protein